MIMRKLLKIYLFSSLLFFGFLTQCLAGNNLTYLETDENKVIKTSDFDMNLKQIEKSNFNLYDDGDVRLAIMNIQVDVLGVLFFGPQVSLDFQFANVIAIGTDFTWHYAGFLYQGFMTEFFNDGTTLGLGTYGIGGHMKFLIPAGSGRNRPYVDFGYEKFFGEETYDDFDLGDKKYSEYKSNVLHVGVGYKRITEGSFNFSIGLSVAVSKVAESLYYYDSNPDEINYYEPGETMVFPLLQMTLGWQIGTH